MKFDKMHAREDEELIGMKIHTTNFCNVFIAVAVDCIVSRAEAPSDKESKSQARIEYEQLINHPCLPMIRYASSGKRKELLARIF